MKLKMLTSMSGPTLTLAPDDEHEFEAAEAKRLIEAGFAVPVASKKAERAAKNPAPEKRG